MHFIPQMCTWFPEEGWWQLATACLAKDFLIGPQSSNHM